MILFWKENENNGYLSQWYKSEFKEDVFSFISAEQYMMWKKAFLFSDYKTAHKILDETEPKKIKQLGRMVVGFIESIWAKYSSRRE